MMMKIGMTACKNGIAGLVSGMLASSDKRKVVTSSDICISPICRLPEKRIVKIKMR